MNRREKKELYSRSDQIRPCNHLSTDKTNYNYSGLLKIKRLVVTITDSHLLRGTNLLQRLLSASFHAYCTTTFSGLHYHTKLKLLQCHFLLHVYHAESYECKIMQNYIRSTHSHNLLIHTD